MGKPVSYYIAAPSKSCYIRASDGNIYGCAANYHQFRMVVEDVSPVKCDVTVNDNGYVAVDRETSRALFTCMFNDYVDNVAVKSLVKAKLIMGSKQNGPVGTCKDYEGFMKRVKEIEPNHDIAFPHSPDRKSYRCTNANNEILYWVK